MLPAGPLMIEHRLIERLIKLMAAELENIKNRRTLDPFFIGSCLDFLKTYADRCHHGKEEDILFRELDKKDLAPDHRRILEELIHEHGVARENVRRIETALPPYLQGNQAAVNEIIFSLETLVALYPAHVDKEDNHFFLPCMDYFSTEEKEKMLKDFAEFDRRLMHQYYGELVSKLEKKEG